MGAKLNEQLTLAVNNSAAKGIQIKFADPTADFHQLCYRRRHGHKQP